MSFCAGKSSQGLAATESSTNSPNAICQGNKEAAATATGSQTDRRNTYSDSGFFENGESTTPRTDYNDFQLYQDDLPEIDSDTDRFFADADASVRSQDNSFYSSGYDSGVELDDSNSIFRLSAVEDDALFSDTVPRVAVAAVSAAVYEALKEYDFPSQSADIPALPLSPQPVVPVDPLQIWIGTHLRHEHIAYQLMQQPEPARQVAPDA